MDQAEQLRNLIKRNNEKSEKSAKIITVTSGKGGVGKSNVSINLAIQLAKLNKKVIIFDADIGLANIEIMFGITPRYTLGDLVFNGKNIEEIITRGPLDIGFISGGSGIQGLNNLSNEQINLLVKSIEKLNFLADIIIVDTGAGISETVLQFIKESLKVLVVITPEPTSITDAYSLLKILSRSSWFENNETEINIIINRANSPEEGIKIFEKLETVISRFLSLSVKFLGSIPEDREILNAVIDQVPVSIKNPSGKSSKAFQNLAKGINRDTMNMDDKPKSITQLFYNFLKQR